MDVKEKEHEEMDTERKGQKLEETVDSHCKKLVHPKTTVGKR